MPLDNNAKIGDIITTLEGMQAINQKAELASVIGSPATASDNVATQITNLQTAKNTLATKIGVPDTMPIQAMVDELVVGKKWVSGTASTTSSTAPLVVSGLTFKPSVIIWWASNFTGVYLENDERTRYVKNASILQTGNSVGELKSAASITNTGFSIPTGLSGTHNWIAFE